MAVATKAKPAAQRSAPNRAAPAAAPRAERPSNVPTDRVVAIGRDGKPIWRKAPDDVDKYHVPEEIIPDGWKYGWRRVSVLGQPDVQHQVNLMRNGWTMVPASRHDGLWLPSGSTGNVEIDGLALMEIPFSLWQEAEREEKKKANAQVNDSRRSAGMAIRNNDIENPNNPHAKISVKTDRMPVTREGNAKYDYTLD